MLKVVLDVSVFVDYFIRVRGREEVHERARRVIGTLSKLGCRVYEPFLFEIELSSILMRCGFNRTKTQSIVRGVLEHVIILREEELHDVALEVALATGCRAIDAYYIATTVKESTILVTCDRIMCNNAKRFNVEAYNVRLHEDYANLMNKLTMIQN